MITVKQIVVRSSVENASNLLNEEIVIEKYFLGIRFKKEYSLVTYDIAPGEEYEEEFNENNNQRSIGFRNEGEPFIREEDIERDFEEEEGY